MRPCIKSLVPWRVISALVTFLAVAAGGVAVGGIALVGSSPGAGAESLDRPSGGGRDSADGSRAGKDPSAEAAPLTPVAANPTVPAPRRVVAPDVMAVANGSIDPATLRDVAEIPGVRGSVPFDGGSVRLRGRPVGVLGVRPATFRGWTPPPTATTDGVWAALARGELVASTDGGGRLEPGETYRLEGRESTRVRLGAVAASGLPGVDVLVGESTSRRLGLVRDLGVLVDADGADIRELSGHLRALLGEKTQIVTLREDEPDASPTAAAQPGKAQSYLELYKQAAARCRGLSWTVLAAIGQIESGHGRNNGPSIAGALGPMQFMPGTWEAYGIDGDGDGRAEVMNPDDAVPSAAEYLCANGAGRGGAALADAIWHYNHAGWYVRDVLSLARAYARRHG